MLSVPGYTVGDVVYQGTRTLIIRGTRNDDNTPVLFKMLQPEYIHTVYINRLKHEYEISKKIKDAGILKIYEMINTEETSILVLEDFGGMPLSALINSKTIDIKFGIEISVKLAQILQVLEDNNIIHKDINPQNILINKVTGEIKLSDFGISVFSNSIVGEELIYGLEGTIQYISPEQTGRVNFPVDYRTDYYSLGVTIYELLTGEPPFKSNDAMEVIHCHLAKNPIEPDKIKSGIPVAISQIIMKLMNKRPDNRYQSAYGLKRDLQMCIETINEPQNKLKLGQWDHSKAVKIPQKLFGREKEIKQLQSAFERAYKGNTEVVLVSGDHGTGKTSLVKQLRDMVFSSKGYFISGAFEESKQDTPYYPFIQALRELIVFLLTDSEENILKWKECILKALGNNCSLISEYIPEIDMIIGKQPKPLELNSVESNKRLYFVFKNFINVFAKKDHPLVIFIENLHLADAATIKLLQTILSDNNESALLFIGSYLCDSRVNQEPGFGEEIALTDISLSSISLKDIIDMVSETFMSDMNITRQLSSIIYKKTYGNPFSINALIKLMDKKRLVYWDREKNDWYFDMHGINFMEITDNVVDSLNKTFETLPDKTKRTLQTAACIGVEFDENFLSMLMNDVEQLRVGLFEAMEESIIVCNQSYFILNGPESNEKKHSALFRFSHQKIYNIIYQSIDDGLKTQIHYRIGFLLKSITKESSDKKLYETARHLNLGSKMASEEDKIIIANANLLAGIKAKLASAYEQALKYLSEGIGILPGNPWQNQYKLVYELYLNLAECFHLNNDYDNAEQTFSALLDNSSSSIDKARIFKLKVSLYTNQVKIDDAINNGLQALRVLGVHLPKKPLNFHVAYKFAAANVLLWNKSFEDLFNLKKMTDPQKLMLMETLHAMIPMAYLSDEKLFVLIILESVIISILHGNSYISSATYCIYGFFAGVILGNYHKAFQYGQLGLKLNEIFDYNEVKSMCYFYFGWLDNQWGMHLNENIVYLDKGIDIGIENGDFVYAAYCMAGLLINMAIIGQPLSNIYCKSNDYINILNQTQNKDKGILSVCLISQKFSANLMGLSKDMASLDCMDACENDFIEGDYKDGISEYYYYKLILLYIFDFHEEALKLADKSIKVVERKVGVLYGADFYYYYCLSITSMFHKLTSAQQKKYLKVLKKLQKKFNKWSKVCAENFLHKYILIKAEISRIEKADSVSKLYNDAVEAARRSGYIQHQAIANELAAKYYLHKGMDFLAAAYIKEAMRCYYDWGAAYKFNLLHKNYISILGYNINSETRAMIPVKGSNSITSSTEKSYYMLDMATVLKATQAISSEIILEELLKRLIKILLENMGAQKVYFILKEDNEFYIKSYGNIESVEVKSSEKALVSQSDSLPLSVINYVSHTKESIILDNVAQSEVFGMDTYIIDNQPKSILCAPVVDKGELKGIIYLENNLLSGAFTVERLNLLKIISAQMAISIENAKLYSYLLKREEELEKYRGHLEELVDERTKKLSEAMDSLKRTQNHLIESEKMAALGQLVAGIAHEINTPLGAIQASIGNITNYFNEMILDFPELILLLNGLEENFIELIKKSINAKDLYSSREKRNLKKQMLQKLSSYHIVNADNIADILIDMSIYTDVELFMPILKDQNNMKIIRFAYSFSGFFRNSKNIEIATERASKIVFALKRYAHYDNSSVMKKTNIISSIETVLTLYHNQFKHGVEVVRDYHEVPEILCYSDELNQVWTNIIHNALQAMEYKGKLTLRIRKDTKYIIVSVEDTGKGIPQEFQNKIFDPFFTTKPQGEGTGLGLDIVKKIVERHCGSIEFNSVPGCTEFIIKLPVRNC